MVYVCRINEADGCLLIFILSMLIILRDYFYRHKNECDTKVSINNATYIDNIHKRMIQYKPFH